MMEKKLVLKKLQEKSAKIVKGEKKPQKLSSFSSMCRIFAKRSAKFVDISLKFEFFVRTLFT